MRIKELITNARSSWLSVKWSLSSTSIILQSNIKVMRIKELITNARSSWLSVKWSLSSTSIILQSNIKVMRIKELITNARSSWLSVKWSLSSTTGNVKRTVKRIWILMLEFYGLRSSNYDISLESCGTILLWTSSTFLVFFKVHQSLSSLPWISFYFNSIGFTHTKR